MHLQKEAAEVRLAPCVRPPSHSQWEAGVFKFKGLSSSRLIASFSCPHPSENIPSPQKWCMFIPTRHNILWEWDSGVQAWYQGESAHRWLYQAEKQDHVTTSVWKWNSVSWRFHIEPEQVMLWCSTCTAIRRKCGLSGLFNNPEDDQLWTSGASIIRKVEKTSYPWTKWKVVLHFMCLCLIQFQNTEEQILEQKHQTFNRFEREF